MKISVLNLTDTLQRWIGSGSKNVIHYLSAMFTFNQCSCANYFWYVRVPTKYAALFIVDTQ